MKRKRNNWNLNSLNSYLKNTNRNLIFREYNGSNKKSKCECLICGHGKNGEWSPRPNDILHNHGCVSCAGLIPKKLLNINEQLKDRNLVFHEYNGLGKKSKCECLICGHGKNGEWTPKPRDVIHKKSGCPCCAKWNLEKYSLFLQQNTSFICYEFTTSVTKTKHECLICGHGKNGEWNPRPNDILHGSGCPICRGNTLKNNSTLKHFLYYIKINHNYKTYYKIGITRKTLKQRFKSDFNKMEVLFCIEYETGILAWEIEQQIIKHFYKYRYFGPKILKYAGNSEIFVCDIFNGDYCSNGTLIIL